MSQYKSTVRSQQGTSKSSPYHEKATQLHELFPDLAVDEIEMLLTEVNGDVQLAAARITDGALQPWEVSRKKEKKPPTTHSPKLSTANRGDSRGARAGRGGRVGARGRGGLPKSTGNGHVPQAESTFILSAWDDLPNGTTEGSKSDSVEQITKSATELHDQQNGISTSTSGKISQTEHTTQVASSWGHTLEGGANGGTSQITHPPVSRQPSKTPATSKLSWAQIARSQEKPTTVAPLATPLISHPVQEAVPESELELDVDDIGREEPTTVEGPTWDDSKQLPVAEAWPPTDVTTELAQAQSPPAVALESHPEDLEPPKANEPVGDTKQEPGSTSAPVVATPSPSNPSRGMATPSPKFSSRPAVSSHRGSARYKVTDQPVTLPLSFGAGIEKVGMQFGSLSVGEASITETSQNETEAPVAESTSASIPQSKPEAAAPLPPATAPPTSTSLTSMFQQQHGPNVSQSQQSQTFASVQPSIPHHTLPTSISQPIISNQTNVHTPTASSLHQFSQQQSSVQQQQQPTPTHHVAQHQSQHPASLLQPPSQQAHLPQQVQQNQPVHSLNQHVMLVHLDQTQQTQTQQPLQPTAHSTYFRGSDTSATSPYFHAPTPPVAQTQDNSYGSFGQLASQGQHQQASHSNNFGSNDYPYNERFYESYTAQQQGFSTRNPLGHDDIKVIPGSQQSSASTLPPSAAQGPQPHSAQASGQQAQPASGQGPQQNYPPPVPYYFPHAYPQNQYYGSPYSSGYVPQPFVKYPTMFQPGPPGPGSAGNPTAKQPGNVGVQPQTPYNGSLYQQAGYEDYQTHQHSQHQHQHSHSLGLGQGMSDYSKQLYGAGQGSMQGFMGLGAQNSSGGTAPTSNAGPRGSPETPYKPYAKDVNVTRSVQGQQGQGQVPPQSQVQGPNGQGSTGQNFYGGNRFGGGASSSSVGGGPQQGGQQGHLGYPQGVNDANFYGYQPRQQQGYWQ